MKNIAVGKKILIGFLAVIAMIVVILALTVVTSLTRNNDLTRANTLNDMQREANKLIDNFNLARVEIRTVFTSTNADTEYAAAVDKLAEVEANLGNLDNLSAGLDGYMADDLATLRTLLNQVQDSIDAVHANDTSINGTIEEMNANGTTMVLKSSELFDMVHRISVELGEEDLARGMERMTSVIPLVQDLNEAVSNVRANSRALTLLQDTSIIETLNADLDELVENANSIRGVLSTDQARAATDEVMAATNGFKDTVSQVVATVNNSNATIADARVLFLELAELVEICVNNIATDVADMNDSTITTSMMVMFIMIGVGVAAAIFSIIVALVLGRMITRPLGKMRAVMVQAGETGNLKFSDEVRDDVRKEAEAKDELGQSLKAFSSFVGRITYMADCLAAVAAKDLTVEIEPLGNNDTMGVALKAMVDNLNSMFAEINSISSQVATAANEVAMGAQGLAQGSTEQASTIEEISASVNEINEQMNTSNETATHAAQQGNAISHAALEGNEKMNHMTGSMHEINDASQAIGNVIKVIDDIAFQTNILALNAAVEAARAGEHGKGFAVVADEVRNLAGKSADAAKETATLISANIEKTELGLTYTQDTAESLSQIIDGIKDTSSSLQLVAEQSEAAKAATAQVNLAIDQVAQVVQQNSATSEESAAASQEMSSQAQMLQQLIAQFKLKDIQGGPGALPPKGGAPDAQDDASGPAPDIVF